MSVSSHLKLENQICHSLYSATNALVRSYRPLLEAIDLTYPQYLVMLALWDEDNVMIKRLVERTRFDAGTLTPILKRLADKGLIDLTKSTEDSRQKVVVVTPDGRALSESAEAIPEALICRIDMSLEEAMELKALAEQLYHKLSLTKTD